jgi:hypothetical protein|tara:strand:+ start:87 stop:266 length:180 start_codon:yes stop_codon:yes gene_type:complete
MFEVGDLVEFRYNLIPDLPVGIVTYAYMYNGYMWYKVQWAVGRQQDIAEIELRKIITDK